MLVDLYLVYSFIKRLTTPFDKWPAYDLKIIDAEGNILKKRKDFLTVAERSAFGIYDLMILKLKKLLAKIPGGQTRIASYAAALWLIKEQNNIEEYADTITEDILELSFNQYLDYTTESYNVNKNFESMIEDIAANSAGGGAIAGIGVGPDGEPGVSKKIQRKIQKKGSLAIRRFKEF